MNHNNFSEWISAGLRHVQKESNYRMSDNDFMLLVPFGFEPERSEICGLKLLFSSRSCEFCLLTNMPDDIHVRMTEYFSDYVDVQPYKEIDNE